MKCNVCVLNTFEHIVMSPSQNLVQNNDVHKFEKKKYKTFQNEHSYMLTLAWIVLSRRILHLYIMD